MALNEVVLPADVGSEVVAELVRSYNALLEALDNNSGNFGNAVVAARANCRKIRLNPSLPRMPTAPLKSV